MKKNIFVFSFIILLLSFMALLIVSSSSFRQSIIVEDWNLRPITNIRYEVDNGQIGSVILPTSFKQLSPRTSVTLSAETNILPGESLFLKSVFAPMKLYINNELFYEYGQAGSYPSFLNDPPTGIVVLKLPKDGGNISIRIEYKSLTQRDSLSVPIFYIGDQSAILNKLLKSDGFSFLFSLMLIFLGLIMTIISITFLGKIPSGMSFLWLGLFSLLAGIWVFGECDLVSRIFPYPSLLYVLDYMGLFFLVIPFLHFGLIILNPKNKLPIRAMLWIHYVSVTTAIILQLRGRVDFIKSLFWFHIITPLAFVFFAVFLLWEWIKNKNPASRRFAPATFILSLSTLIELANYWFHFTNTFTLFFQFGVLFFIISLGIVSGHYVRESLNATIENQKLEYKMENIEKQLSLQRLQYEKMTEDEERIKKERHDIRHHLATLKALSADKKALDEYIDQLTNKSVINNDILLCENYAINAIASYYYNMAMEAGIHIAASLTISRDLPAYIESDLSIVIGNLMENAVEACKLMSDTQKKFININSSIKYDILTITVDNSYSSNVKRKGNVFFSSKRAGEGIGISSVIAVAQKYNGGTKFEEQNGVFKASIYLKTSPQPNLSV